MINLTADLERNIANLLIGQNILDEDQVEKCSATSAESGKSLLETMIYLGYVGEDQITEAISVSYGIDKLPYDEIGVVADGKAITELPASFITDNRILPFKLTNNTIEVAIADPSSLAMLGNVRTITGKSVKTYIISLSEMEKQLKVVESLSRKPAGQAPPTVKTETTPTTRAVKHPADVISFVDTILGEAIKSGVSDIHVEPYKYEARMRYRIDGILYNITDCADYIFNHYAAVTTRIKIMSSLNIAERRLPQDGAIVYNIDGRDVDIRVSVLPSSFGERIVMRILDRGAIELTLDSLGFIDQDLANFKKSIDAPQGMVLVTGPTGSGKSTTLYAALGRLNREEVNILTAEDPVEYNIDGVGQVQIKEEIGLTFAAALRSFLRQDPEIVLVGEIRDKETVDIAIKAALTGHLVLSTLHTNDAPSTITRLINMGVPPYLITASLTLVVAQRLARRNCQKCNAIDKGISDSHLTALGFSPEEVSRTPVYAGKGCPSCKNSGYKGRQGIYEVLNVTERVKEAILKGESSSGIREMAVKDGFSTMQKAGREFIKQGVISVDEYKRVLLSY